MKLSQSLAIYTVNDGKALCDGLLYVVTGSNCFDQNNKTSIETETEIELFSSAVHDNLKRRLCVFLQSFFYQRGMAVDVMFTLQLCQNNHTILRF